MRNLYGRDEDQQQQTERARKGRTVAQDAGETVVVFANGQDAGKDKDFAAYSGWMCW